MVNFLPTILNQLFCVLTRATHEDVAVNVTRQATHTRTLNHICIKFLVSCNRKQCVTAVFLVRCKNLICYPNLKFRVTALWIEFYSKGHLQFYIHWHTFWWFPCMACMCICVWYIVSVTKMEIYNSCDKVVPYVEVHSNFVCVFIYFHLRVMVHVVAQCHEEGLEHYLRSYVKVLYFSYLFSQYALISI